MAGTELKKHKPFVEGDYVHHVRLVAGKLLAVTPSDLPI